MPTQQPADLLIEARWVLPVAPPAALFDHAVAVAGGRIVALGPSAQLAARFAPRERATRPHHVLLPGFVNAHTRAGRTLLRGRPVRSAQPDAGASRAAPGAVPARAPDASWVSADLVRDSAQLAAAEMLRAGITCFASRDLYPEEVARVAAAARMRACVGLPVEERSTAWAEDLTDHLAKAERLWDEYRSDPWVSLHFAPDAAPGLSDATLVHLRTVADELDARVMMPLNETEQEVRESRARHGGASSVERLRSLGLLRPGFTALYASRLESSELELAARTGIAAVACPQASLRRGLGFPRLTELAERGVAVGLGSGSPTDAFALDVLAEARTAALVTSGACAARDALPPERALELATLGGAAALGLKTIAGSIEPGKAADLIALDLSSMGCQPDSTPAEAVLFGATRERVSDVWINGLARVAHGRLLAYDEQEMLELARRWDERLSGAAAPPAGAGAEARGA